MDINSNDLQAAIDAGFNPLNFVGGLVSRINQAIAAHRASLAEKLNGKVRVWLMHGAASAALEGHPNYNTDPEYIIAIIDLDARTCTMNIDGKDVVLKQVIDNPHSIT